MESVSNLFFNEAFDCIRSDIQALVRDLGLSSELQDRVEILLQYNVPHGKKLRGRMLVEAFDSICENGTTEQRRMANILGWCIEILQASFLVADDIMDGGETRRGKPCWYLVENIGAMAVNDAFLLEHLVYQLVKKYFDKHDNYASILDLFFCVSFKTVLGQSLDTTNGKNGNLDHFNTNMYNSIVTFKTGYYTVYLPIALAMTLAGTFQKNDNLWREVELVALKMGTLFQIQDDFFDCFAEEAMIGKQGTDIQEGKCSWPFVTALNICSSTQDLELLKSSYGSKCPEKVSLVKQIYQKLDIPHIFEKTQEQLYDELQIMIAVLSNDVLKSVMHKFLAKIYQRLY